MSYTSAYSDYLESLDDTMEKGIMYGKSELVEFCVNEGLRIEPYHFGHAITFKSPSILPTLFKYGSVAFENCKEKLGETHCKGCVELIKYIYEKHYDGEKISWKKM